MDGSSNKPAASRGGTYQGEVKAADKSTPLLTELAKKTSDSFRAKVIARLARKWEFKSRQTGELLELDFVLIDREGNLMEGLVQAKRINKFKDVLKEGSVYTLQYFNLFDARRNYKAVDSPCRICFTQRTQIQEIAPPPNFPFFAYNAVPFSIAAGRINNNALLSDVVGMIVAVTDESTTMINQQCRRHVILSDGSERAIVTLWDEHAKSFDAAGLLNSSTNEPIVVLFVGMTVGQYTGLLAFQSTSVTKWYINIPIPEMPAIRERFTGRPHQIEWQNGANPCVEPVQSTIKSIAQELPNIVMGKRFKLKVLITELVSTNDWWYLACKGCWKKTQPHGEAYQCPCCPVTKGGPRYRIVVNGIDVDEEGNENAETAQFTFFGPAGEALVGKEELILVGNTRDAQTNTPVKDITSDPSFNKEEQTSTPTKDIPATPTNSQQEKTFKKRKNGNGSEDDSTKRGTPSALKKLNFEDPIA